MSLRDTMREYRKATFTIFAGIGLIIFGFIVGFVSIALGVLFLYTPSDYSYSSSKSDSELFKWAVSAGAFGFCCIIAGYSMIGGGCRMCFSSCSECCSNGCGRMDCSDFECCDCGSCCSDYCWSLGEMMKSCCGCCVGKAAENQVSYNMDSYEASRQEHTIVHLGYENNETKEEIPLEVLQMQQQQLSVQPIHAADVKIQNPNVPAEDSDNNYSNDHQYGGFSGVVAPPIQEEPTVSSAFVQVGIVDQAMVEYHRSESNNEVMEINAPTQV